MYIHITHIFTQNIDFHNNFSISIWLDCMYIKETQVEKNYKNSQSHTENKPLLHQKISKITFLGLLLRTLVVVAVIPRASRLTHFRCTVTLCGENCNNWLVHNMCGKFFFRVLGLTDWYPPFIFLVLLEDSRILHVNFYCTWCRRCLCTFLWYLKLF